jgi:hypothetical protein
MSASAVDAEMLDAVVRLVRLIDSPAEQKVVAPLVIKEIVYRLLASGQGGRLSHLLRRRRYATDLEGHRTFA